MTLGLVASIASICLFPTFGMTPALFNAATQNVEQSIPSEEATAVSKKLQDDLARFVEKTALGREILEKNAAIAEGRVAYAKQFSEVQLKCRVLKEKLTRSSETDPPISDEQKKGMEIEIRECEAETRSLRYTLTVYTVVQKEIAVEVERVTKEVELWAARGDLAASRLKMHEKNTQLKNFLDEAKRALQKYDGGEK